MCQLKNIIVNLILPEASPIVLLPDINSEMIRLTQLRALPKLGYILQTEFISNCAGW